MRAFVLALVVPFGLAACGNGLFSGGGLGIFQSTESARITFDGQRFRGSAKPVDRADRRDFIATAGPASRSMAGVREAVRYQGTRYCIRWFGISDIAWEIDPQAETVPLEGDKVVLRGRCVE